MEDRMIRDLFSDFEAPLSSSEKFLENLERNIRCIENVKRQNEQLKRIYKKAVFIASGAGFFFGMLFSLLLPYLKEIIGIWIESLSKDNLMYNYISENSLLIAWVLIASFAIFAALNAYELSLSLFKSQSSEKQ